MPRVSIEFDVTDEQVQTLLGVLGVPGRKALAAPEPRRDSGFPEPGSSPRDFFHGYDSWAAEEAPDPPILARRFKTHLGAPTWEMLVAAAKEYPDVFFTVENLAAALGTDARDVRKRIRALGRSRVLKELDGLVDAESEADTHPWFRRWDGHRSLYCFPHPDWSKAILDVAAETDAP